MIPDLTNPYLSNGSLSPGARTVSSPCSIQRPLPSINPSLPHSFTTFCGFGGKETEWREGCLRKSNNLDKKKKSSLCDSILPYPPPSVAFSSTCFFVLFGEGHTHIAPPALATQTLQDFDSSAPKFKLFCSSTIYCSWIVLHSPFHAFIVHFLQGLTCIGDR